MRWFALTVPRLVLLLLSGRARVARGGILREPTPLAQRDRHRPRGHPRRCLAAGSGGAGIRGLPLPGTGLGRAVVLHRAQADRPDGRAGRVDSRRERSAHRWVSRAARLRRASGPNSCGCPARGRSLSRSAARWEKISRGTPRGNAQPLGTRLVRIQKSVLRRTRGITGSATRATPGPCARHARAGCRRGSDRRAR